MAPRAYWSKRLVETRAHQIKEMVICPSMNFDLRSIVDRARRKVERLDEEMLEHRMLPLATWTLLAQKDIHEVARCINVMRALSDDIDDGLFFAARFAFPPVVIERNKVRFPVDDQNEHAIAFGTNDSYLDSWLKRCIPGGWMELEQFGFRNSFFRKLEATPHEFTILIFGILVLFDAKSFGILKPEEMAFGDDMVVRLIAFMGDYPDVLVKLIEKIEESYIIDVLLE